MADLGAQTLKAASIELGPRLAELCDPAGTSIPRGAAKLLTKAGRSIEFSQAASVALILQAVAILAVYSEGDRAAEAARLLARVPNTGNLTVFEPLRSAIATAAWFQEDATRAAELQAIAVDGWPAHPTRAKGRLLRNPLGRSADEKAQLAGYPAYYFAGEHLAEIEELASIAALGGSLSWSKKKVAAQIEANVAALHEVPGFEPVAG